MSYEAQSDIQDAVRVAIANGYSFRTFVEEARELWVGELADEVGRIKRLKVEDPTP